VLVTGGLLSVSAVVIGVVAVVSRRLPARWLIASGAVASVLGLGLLTLSATAHSLPLFFGGMVLGGAGYSFNFLGGLTLVNAHAPATHRAGMLSSVLVVAYLVQGAAALLLGAVATSGGLASALDVGTPAIGLICVAAVVLVLAVRRPRAVLA
jgi:hypothetical protein